MKQYLRYLLKLFFFSILIIFSCSKSEQSREEPVLQSDEFQSTEALGTLELQESIGSQYVSEPIDSIGTLKIVSYGPVGIIKGQVQIRIDFDTPLIPLTTLSDLERSDALDYFLLEPDVEGEFRFLGSSTVVFQPVHSLPLATDYFVRVKQGLKDIHGNSQDQDFSWRFQTPLPGIRIYPSNNSHHIDPEKEVHIISTVALQLESLRDHLRFSETVSGKLVEFEIGESDRNPKDEYDIGMERIHYDYLVMPEKTLQKDTEYTVTVEAGLITNRGNRPTERSISSRFRTFPPFKFNSSGFCDYCGGKLTTIPYLNFTNRPDFDKMANFIEIEPQTEESPFHSYSCLGYSIGINDYLLEPHTTYKITLKEGLIDIYGQSLENPQTISFTTGALSPKMWGPNGYQIITPNLRPTFGIKTVNINSVSYKLLPLRPEDILVRERLEYYYSIKKLLEEIKSDEKILEIKLNEGGIGKIYLDLKPHLRGENYGVVAYSFRSPKLECFDRPIEFNGLMLRTDIGIFSQFHPTTAVIKLNKLTDGTPIPGAKIRIYREDDLPRLEKIWDLITNREIQKSQPCLVASTDSLGLLVLSAEETARCTKRRAQNKIINELYPPDADPDDIMYDQQRYGFAEPPRLVIIAEAGDDWTFLQTQPNGYPSVWQFGMMSDWEAERAISRGTIFSDHFLYRPGDTVKMKGVSRYLLYGKLMNGQGLEYTIKVRDPHGKEKEIDKVKVNEFGTFHFDIPTEAGQRLGSYQVIAQTPNDRLRFFGSFQLAEFRVPEFEVRMNIDKKYALPGDPVQISWEGKYYFGAPMVDASSSLNITRRKTYFRPAGWDEFSFGIPEYLLDKKVSLSGTYLKETITLNKKGTGLKTIKLQKEDIPYPMQYNSDVEVEDVSKQTIAANKTITALPDHRLIGIKLSNWIGTKNKPVEAFIVVSSPEGNALTDIPVTVKLIKKEYHSIKTKTPDGLFTTEHHIEKKEIEVKEVRSAASPVQVNLTPLEAGSYVIWAELSQKPQSGTAAATSLWIAGDDYVPWEDTGEDKLEIIMDKKEYQIGDEAVAFIQSPFPEAELFLTVCREKIFLEDLRKIKGSAYTYRFQITEEMLPNAFVGAALFRLGEPIVPVEEETGKHIERIGFASFKVSVNHKYLEVTVKPDRMKARPAEELQVNVQINNSAKQGHKSELTVMVVDEAVLSLSGYTPPDLVRVVYSERGLSARINDNRPFIITEAELLQKGTGYGGGLMEGMAGPRVRKEFLKLAYYNPHLLTDESGKAFFRFKLPDNLTTWRIMIVAVGSDNLFGYQDEKIVVTQPFITRAVLPRFSRIGDQFFAGIAITNLTEAEGEVKVKPEISGSSVTIDNQGLSEESSRIKTGESQVLLFPFNAVEIGQSILKFTALFTGVYEGNNLSEADALEVPLEVKALTTTETVVEVGETTDQFSQKIKKDESIRNDMGGLAVVFSSTALNNIGEGAKYLVNYPYGCLEQTASRLLALIQLKYLADKYNFVLESAKPLDQVIEANLRKVLLMQNHDGGFKFWPTSSHSTCYLSPYVAYLLKRIKDLGYEVPQEVIQNLLGYLDNTLRNPCYPIPTWKGLAEYRINVLLGLHYLGNRDQTYFEEYFNRRQELSYGAQIGLATLLFQAPTWKTEALKMFQEIQNGLFVTAQTAHLESPRELPPSWLFMYSPVITTAEAVKLFLAVEPENKYITKMARYLLNARKNGRWRYTYENARAIDALVEISLKKEAKAPDYTAVLKIAGDELLRQSFKGHHYKPFEKFIPITDLPKGLNDMLISKDGSGNLYYTLSYIYRLKGAQPARQEGFSIKRTVKRKDTGKLLLTYQNDPPEKLQLKAGDVLEVELEFLVPQNSYNMVIDDPIPAGLEAIDASLKTTSSRYDRRSDERTREDSYQYWGNPINHTELRDDHVALFADAVRPGIYKYQYLLRATTAGSFLWPASRISLMYEPEQFGTCAEGEVTVSR